MSDSYPKTAVETYLEAFGKTSPDEREQLLRASVVEHVAFSNPGVNGRGLRDLLAHTARFQERFPGGHFRINWLREQHGQMLAEWTQLGVDGSEFITAHSYARLDGEGLITHFAGFWEPL